MQSRSGLTRRTYLRLTGLATLMTGLAGCSEGGDDGGGGDGGEDGDGGDGDGGDGDDGGDGTLSREDYPAVDEWLTETEVGGEAPNYDGTIMDQRETDTIQIDVGAGDTGIAFEPAAVAVSPGTTVQWEWTGDGGAHNVVAEPDNQIGESDYEFSSGDPVDEEGETYEQTLDDSGIALYHCVPHLSVGMKGAVVVE